LVAAKFGGYRRGGKNQGFLPALREKRGKEKKKPMTSISKFKKGNPDRRGRGKKKREVAHRDGDFCFFPISSLKR